MNRLHQLLRLQPLSLNKFKTISKPRAPPGSKGTFGGILVSQSLLASLQTVPVDFNPSSLHCYFIVGGNPEHPIEYDVESLRSGKNFIHKQVKAYQFDKLIFTSTVMFYKEPPAEKLHSLDHLSKLDTLPAFDKYVRSSKLFEDKVLSRLPDYQRIAKSFNEPGQVAEFQDRFENGIVEYRFPENFFDNELDADRLDYYLRVRDVIPCTSVPEFSPNTEISPENDRRFNYVAFAFLSDSYVLLSLPYFHQLPLYSHTFSVSLDHSIHFHQLPKVNNWMYAQLFNPRSHHDKHVIFGHFFDRSSRELVATINQEGLVSFPQKEKIRTLFRKGPKL